ncbi:hypothetical protein [Geoalkalibacter sp.]|uniref:hypothetical protein n=1 Tax=Geoalkalibacter sp. TaxID=3041440 RepID=UPI00272DE59A|nr:hypothetical protein [Geoalkalibacter sp.]
MRLSLRRISSLARIVVLDGLRRHALIGLVLLALACETGGLFFFGFIPRDIGRASSDFILTIGWLAGFIFLFFHAVHVTAWDEEKRVLHTLLARPLSRAEYVLGTFSGLGILLFLLNMLLGGIGWLILHFIQRMVGPNFFAYFSHGYYVLSLVGILAIQFMILAVIILFSGLVRGSFTVLLLALSFYFISSGLPVVRESLATQGAANFLPHLLQGLSAVFPNFGRLDFKPWVVQVASTPEWFHVALNFLFSVLYCGIILGLACAVYHRRDLK